jgi:hypothetical protein
MKECAHHIVDNDLEVSFALLKKYLKPDGFILIYWVKGVDTYPEFPDNLKKFFHQTNPTVLDTITQKLGFATERKDRFIPVTISSSFWLSFFEKKTWSTFAICGPREFEIAIADVKEKIKDKETVSFNHGHVVTKLTHVAE